jgi:hypothetical protein
LPENPSPQASSFITISSARPNLHNAIGQSKRRANKQSKMQELKINKKSETTTKKSKKTLSTFL